MATNRWVRWGVGLLMVFAVAGGCCPKDDADCARCCPQKTSACAKQDTCEKAQACPKVQKQE